MLSVMVFMQSGVTRHDMRETIVTVTGAICISQGREGQIGPLIPG